MKRDEKEEKMVNEVGERLVAVLKQPQCEEGTESFARALEITKAYAASGAASHYSSVSRLFYELFEMFETGRDPRQK